MWALYPVDWHYSIRDITLGRLAQSYDLRSLGDCRTSLALRGDLTVGSFGRRIRGLHSSGVFGSFRQWARFLCSDILQGRETGPLEHPGHHGCRHLRPSRRVCPPISLNRGEVPRLLGASSRLSVHSCSAFELGYFMAFTTTASRVGTII